jgi:hypothetical protein
MKKRLFFLMILVAMLFAITFGCGPNIPAPSPKIQKATEIPSLDQETIDRLAKTEEALSKLDIKTSTPVVEEVGGIEISYEYTDSLITSLYHLYGKVLDNFVDITLTNHDPETVTLIVETSIEGYTTKASDTVYLNSGESFVLHQNPRLMAEAVDKLNSEKPGNFLIKVIQTDPGPESVLVDESKEILLYSRRDFVWIDGIEPADEFNYWAAWVTPTDPTVEKLIRLAANYSDSGTISSGYTKEHPNDDDGNVWDRLEAVWKAEDNDFNLTYVSTMVAFGPNTIQRIRMPSEVLDQASGNCIELALLYASAAEAMSLESAIIRIPGHAYVGVRMDQTNANYYFIESTMIGRASFADAVKTGAAEWKEAFPHFEAKEEGYAWVTIQDAWKKGILPIPWK